MPRAVATKPRKSASQERSRAMVETLLDATARVLVREGYDRASTNRIATVAGVSIGSLYQYFPNKEALVAALVARHNREILELVRGALKTVGDQGVPAAIRALVTAAVDAHLVDSALHRIFDEQVPRMGQLAKIEALEGEAFQLFKGYLEAHRNEITAHDLNAATAICVISVEALTHQFVINKPQALPADRARFIDEVTRLIVGYLQPGTRR